jgi:hypothetical protein
VAAADARPVRRRLLFAALLLAVVRLGADTSLETGINSYVGSDGVSVVSPQSEITTDLDDRTQVALHYGVDAVSAASWNYAKSKTHMDDMRRTVGNCKLCHSGVDAISGASLGYRDTRQELSVSVVRHVGETDIIPSYIRSQEDDYLAQTLGLGLSQNLFSRDTNVALNYRHGDNQSIPVWNLNDVNELSTDTGTLTVTQVLTRLSEVRVNAELDSMRGYLANPYSFIQVGDDTLHPVPETEPGVRNQVVAGGVYKQALGWDSALELDYRYYADSWAVVSDTLQGGLDKQWGPFTVKASWRYYTQTQAWFFQNFYARQQPYMSRDLKLAAFNDDLCSLGLRGRLSDNWDFDLSDGYYARHDRLNYSLYYSNGPVMANMFSISFTLH